MLFLVSSNPFPLLCWLRCLPFHYLFSVSCIAGGALKSISYGQMPVIACRVVLYVSSMSETANMTSDFAGFFSIDLKVCTICSTSPFD